MWLNVDSSSRIARLHKETCIYCKPHDQNTKGINKISSSGGWFKFESVKEAQQFYKDNKPNLFWQPCKVCQLE